jgi:hypothetical protein
MVQSSTKKRKRENKKTKDQSGYVRRSKINRCRSCIALAGAPVGNGVFILSFGELVFHAILA